LYITFGEEAEDTAFPRNCSKEDTVVSCAYSHIGLAGVVPMRGHVDKYYLFHTRFMLSFTENGLVNMPVLGEGEHEPYVEQIIFVHVDLS
jgi:hypothetical protein